MNICPYVGRSGSLLSAMFLSPYKNKRNARGYTTVRMSTLRDELYPEDQDIAIAEVPDENINTLQNEDEHNKQIVDLNDQKKDRNKRVIRIKIKISETKPNANEKNDTVVIKTNNSNQSACADEISNRSYVIELTETNISEKLNNENFTHDNQDKNGSENLKVDSQKENLTIFENNCDNSVIEKTVNNSLKDDQNSGPEYQRVFSETERKDIETIKEMLPEQICKVNYLISKIEKDCINIDAKKNDEYISINEKEFKDDAKKQNGTVAINYEALHDRNHHQTFDDYKNNYVDNLFGKIASAETLFSSSSQLLASEENYLIKHQKNAYANTSSKEEKDCINISAKKNDEYIGINEKEFKDIAKKQNRTAVINYEALHDTSYYQTFDDYINNYADNSFGKVFSSSSQLLASQENYLIKHQKNAYANTSDTDANILEEEAAECELVDNFAEKNQIFKEYKDNSKNGKGTENSLIKTDINILAADINKLRKPPANKIYKNMTFQVVDNKMVHTDSQDLSCTNNKGNLVNDGITNTKKEIPYKRNIRIVRSYPDLTQLIDIEKFILEKEHIQKTLEHKSKYDATHNKKLLDAGKNRDSLIIKDIIMGRFGSVLDRFMQKSLRRKQKKNRPTFYNNKETTEVNDILNNPSVSPPCSSTPDSGLDGTEELDNSNYKSAEFLRNSNQTLESQPEYNSTLFLREALGDEYMNITYDSEQENSTHYRTRMSNPQKQCIGERSIGSSEISTLISTINGVDSLYSTVDKSKKKRRPSVLNKTPETNGGYNSPNNYIYESIEKFKIDPRSEELSDAINVQCATIIQALNALNFCRQSQVFFGSIPHLEAEKCLLISTLKKKILEFKRNGEYEEIAEDECHAIVNIENLMFSTYINDRVKMNNIREYYMCLVCSDIILLASDIIIPNENGELSFKNSFQFNNLPSDFEIHIKIYCMTLDRNLYKKKSYFSPNMKHLLSKNGKMYSNHLNQPSYTSSFQLLGICKLGVSDLFNSNTFTLEEVQSNGKISHLFTANIHTSIQINNRISGFLTIGTTNISWNRRWCTLKGPYLKYWNYPSDENVKEPIGILNLADCVTTQVTNVRKDICSRPRTILLKMKSETGIIKAYFLQADNLLEFEEWKRQLNSVLISLKNWRFF